MSKLNWIAGPDGNTLCAEGHPLRIRRNLHADPPFTLEHNGHRTMTYWALTSAKLDAERSLDEDNEFASQRTDGPDA